MRTSSHHDIIFVGAGPVGLVASAAFARKGARVLLLEAHPGASRRLAGEWLHPPGVQALRQLDLLPEELLAKHPAGRGFAVFPDDTSDPMRLPYQGGEVALTADHGALVSALRGRVRDLPGVDYRAGARAKGVVPSGLVLADGQELYADLVVGADGRKSSVRRELGVTAPIRTLSHMAGVELRGVELPFEGYGHVLLGGPGPILMYRIAEDSVRLCLDIPVGCAGARRDVAYLHEAFSLRLPEGLRPAFREALIEGRVQWALGRFRARSFYGRGEVALVGDAVGSTHPLTAAGMTLGFADALSLAEAPDVASYAKEREAASYVPELLANALYQVFQRQDLSAESIRQAVFEVWRRSDFERARTMRLLAGEEISLGEFGAAFVKVAGLAAARGLRAEGAPGSRLREVASLEEWARWPAATVMPARLRTRLRPQSSETTPFSSRALSATAAPSARRGLEQIRSSFDASVRAGFGAAPTLRATERLAAMRLGGGGCADSTSFEPAASPSERCAQLQIAVFSAQASAVDVSPELSSLLSSTPHDALAEADWLEALSAVARCLPGLRPAELSEVFAARRGTLLAQPTPTLDSPADLMLAAARLRSLAALDVPSYHSVVRRLVDALSSVIAPGGVLRADLSAHVLLSLARGILESGAPRLDLVDGILARLVEQGAMEEPTPELLEAGAVCLALLDARDAEGPRAARQASAADRALAKQSLLDVSRTFARPIEMLPGDLETAVTCGYLLCRVADTIEDNPNLTLPARDLRYGVFLDVIEGRTPATRFECLWDDVPGRATELHLCKNLGAIMRVFGDLPEGMRTRTIPWVAEMTRGMQLYSHRPAGDDGFTALHTEDDLERYCYYVAGTVGHMLTDLFLEALQSQPGGVDPEVEVGMREHAEGFGLGLQLTNILKDVTDDAERSCSFIPRTVCAREGFGVSELMEPSLRAAAHRAVAPLFDNARQRLDEALEYSLSIPNSAVEMRLFCLLPLFMAVRTLEHARGNDAMFVTEAPVKISRKEVEALISECVTHVSNDATLRIRYAALWDGPLGFTPRPEVTAP